MSFQKMILILLIVAPQAFAARTLKLPRLSVNGYHQFKVSVWGDPIVYADGVKFRSGFAFEIHLDNLSSVEQTGELTIMGGDNSGSSCCFGGVTTVWTTKTGICGGLSSPTATGVNIWPAKVKFKIPPNKSIRLDLYSSYHINYAIANSNTHFVSMTASPSIEIKIDQDRGALLGSISVLKLHSSTYPDCSGSTGDNHQYGRYMNMQGDNQVLLINGGRPF